MTDTKSRIQKLLAQAGVGSRREIEKFITEGAIRVNGQVATLGDKITPEDKIQLNGRIVKLARKLDQPVKVIMYHKPEGQICSTRDPKHKDTVFKHLPRLGEGRWISVGRLDLNSTGLLLLTNDGDLANHLMHPSTGLARVYQVRVRGEVSPEALKQLKQGIKLSDGMAKFDELKALSGQGQNYWYSVTLHEGKNREVRRLFEAVGHQVSRLLRTEYGPIALPRRLGPGRHQYLDEKQIAVLSALQT